MSAANQYKWLIVVEGSTDVGTYSYLLSKYGANESDYILFPVRGRSFVCNATTWDTRKSKLHRASLMALIKHDLGRRGFSGVLLVIDSDKDSTNPFDQYKRNADSSIYVGSVPPDRKRVSDAYWELDSLNGSSCIIPLFGINVPSGSSGCLETDLLSSYGFPIEGQPEYGAFIDIIKKSSVAWNIPKHGNGEDWWEDNSKAKFDKFIYTSILRGFRASGEDPSLSSEPDVIKNIRFAMNVV